MASGVEQQLHHHHYHHCFRQRHVQAKEHQGLYRVSNGGRTTRQRTALAVAPKQKLNLKHKPNCKNMLANLDHSCTYEAPRPKL